MKKPSYEDLELRVRELERRLSESPEKRHRKEPSSGDRSLPAGAADPSPGHGQSDPAGGVSHPVRLEDAIRNSGQFLASVFDAIQEGISVINSDLEIVAANQTLKNWFRRTVPLEGRKCYKVFHERETPCDRCPSIKALRSGKLEMEVMQGRKSVSLELFSFPMLDEAGKVTGVAEFIRNVSFRKTAEEDREKKEMRQQEARKMQAVETLAGGIAHQFNNALASLSLSIELIGMDLPENHPFLRHIQKMKSSTERMAHLTGQLLAYAEGGRYHIKTISIIDFVREVLPSVTRDLYPSVSLELDLAPDTQHVKADVNQIQMALSAVIHNAAEATDGAGWIRVRTRNEPFPENSSDTPPNLAPGPYVCLTVEDNGRGMNEETRKRIFEPFFTTKLHGRGLGLAAVHGIIRGHKGCVLVDSEPGKGTCVKIYLPAAEAGERPLEVREGPVPKGAGTVLLIEDEEMILGLGKELLERLGYHVLTAMSGKEALEISSGFPGKIDLTILDVVLPDMGGREIYNHLMKERPGLKVLVCSGFSVQGPAQEILDAGAQGFLQKPFSLNDLNRQLGEIMKKA